MQLLERFHIWLGVGAAGIGLGTAVVWWLLTRRRPPAGRADPGGRLAVAATVAGLVLVVWDYAFAVPTVVTAGLVLVGGALVRRADRGVVGPMAVVSLLGVWAAVPDTEAPLVALCIVAVPVLLFRPAPMLVIDRLAAIGLVVGVAWIGSAGRVEVLGGIGCVGLLVMLPAAPECARRPPVVWWRLLVAHAVIVVVSARVLTRVSRDVAIVGLAVIAAIAVSGVVRGRRPPGRRGPRR